MEAKDIPQGWDDIVFVYMLGAREGQMDRIKSSEGGGGGGGGGSGARPDGGRAVRSATDAETMQMLEQIKRAREKKGGGK